MNIVQRIQATPEHLIILHDDLQIDVTQLRPETIQSLVMLMEAELESIKAQIQGFWKDAPQPRSMAGKTREEARWYASAVAARKAFGLNIVRLNNERKRRNRVKKERGGVTFERLYLEIAKDVLDAETNKKIIDAAHRRLDAIEAEHREVEMRELSAYEQAVHRQLVKARESNRNRIASTAIRTTFDDGITSVFAVSAGLPSLGKGR